MLIYLIYYIFVFDDLKKQIRQHSNAVRQHSYFEIRIAVENVEQDHVINYIDVLN